MTEEKRVAPMRVLAIRLRPEQFEFLRMLAREEEGSVSSVLRRMITRTMREWEADRPAR